MTVTPGHIQFYFNPQGSREPRQYPFLADTVIRMISIHKALASLDFRAKTLYIQGKRFQSTRLSRASTEDYAKVIGNIYISIHKALASLDTNALYHHESVVQNFNPQGSREPRRGCTKGTRLCLIFQSTRLSRASTCDITCGRINSVISIHKALASLDKLLLTCDASVCNFNPQGSREPRRDLYVGVMTVVKFQSTRLSRASTAKMHNYSCIYATFTCFILYIFYKSFIKLKFPRVI